MLTLAVLLLAAALTHPRAQAQPPARTPDVHFTPTRHAIADAMLQLAGVGPSDVVYDLGSGDGRIPIIAAQKYGARGVGIEIEPVLVERSRQNAAEAQVGDRVTFLVGDLFKADLSTATVVTLYLSPNVLKQITPGLRALAPGTRIVSHQFPLSGWTPDKRITVDEAEIFLWVVPRPHQLESPDDPRRSRAVRDARLDRGRRVEGRVLGRAQTPDVTSRGARARRQPAAPCGIGSAELAG